MVPPLMCVRVRVCVCVCVCVRLFVSFARSVSHGYFPKRPEPGLGDDGHRKIVNKEHVEDVKMLLGFKGPHLEEPPMQPGRDSTAC